MSRKPISSDERDGAEMRAEYDGASIRSGQRGRYARALAGQRLVVLDADVADAFPTAESVNDALRSLMGAAPRR